MAIDANTLPPHVDARLDEPLREYFLDRVRQHLDDSYLGVPMSKFPEDLRVYEHLLWLLRPNVVIELGAWSGGSALWFRDRLRTLMSYGRIAEPRVISVDVDPDRARSFLERVDPEYRRTIHLIAADVCDEDVAARVERLLPPRSNCFIVEDSAHTYQTTYGALKAFSRFVPVGGMFVVEDGCVDIEELRLKPDWPRGVLPAIRDWLATMEGSCFRTRPELELYGISCHPGGWLERVAPSPDRSADST